MRVRVPPALMASLLVVVPMVSIGGGADGPAPGGVVTVDVGNFFFDPEEAVVIAGDTVTWDWVGGTHSVETRDGGDEWCPIQSSGTCDRTFWTPGTYEYRCGLHPTSMLGSIIVQHPLPIVTIVSPVQDDALGGTAEVTGTATHELEVASVELSVDDGPYENATISGETWAIMLDTAGYANGEHTLTARATSSEGTQSTTSVDVRFVNPATINLTVGHIETTTGTLDSATITAAIHNQGNTAASGVGVRFEYVYKSERHIIGTTTVDLGGFDATSTSIEWSADTLVGAFDIIVTVDPADEHPESNETDNSALASAAWWTELVPGIDLNDP